MRGGLPSTSMYYFGDITNQSRIFSKSIHIENSSLCFSDGSKSSKHGTSSSSQGSRWKSMLHSVAKHVSQVAPCYLFPLQFFSCSFTIRSLLYYCLVWLYLYEVLSVVLCVMICFLQG